jgi:hypothetical protein
VRVSQIMEPEAGEGGGPREDAHELVGQAIWLRSRRGGGWNWVGVVSGLLNPNDSGVSAPERRPRHDERYHEGGGWGRRGFAFR